MKTKFFPVITASFLFFITGCEFKNLLNGSNAKTQEASNLANSLPENGRKAVHGMVAFQLNADESIYLSHIPMYHEPHDFQLIIKAHIPAPESVKKIGIAGLHTISPIAFSLNDILAKRTSSFTGMLFKGNFENGGKELTDDIKFDKIQILYQRNLLSDSTPDYTHPKYLLMGNKSAAYLVHLIGSRESPTYDQILKVTLESEFADAKFNSNKEFENQNLSPQMSARLKAGAKATLQASETEKIQIKVTEEISCLQSPDFSKPCN